MGHGIAEVTALAGDEVRLGDIDEELGHSGCERIEASPLPVVAGIDGFSLGVLENEALSMGLSASVSFQSSSGRSCGSS